MMAAPLYFPKLPGWMLGAMFWGGLSIFAVSMIVAITLAILARERSCWQGRAMPIALMVLGTILFFGGAIWLGMVNERVESKVDNSVAPLPQPKPPNVLLIAETGRLVIYNREPRDMEIWGTKFADTPKSIETEGRLLPHGGHYYFLIDSLTAQAVSVIGLNGNRLEDFSVYLSDFGRHYIARFKLLIVVTNGNVNVHAQNIRVEAGEW